MLQLRQYQQKAIGLVYDYFREFNGNPVLELPTSAGKSLIQAAFIEGIFRQWPGQRILCLAHVRELIEQNHAELVGYWKNAPAGINAAALGRRDLREPIIFAMIQSVYKL
ncbi:MAG TPA: DEAD/DEAH box helicase family protein, partial [Acidimicrobiia bacterium]